MTRKGGLKFNSLQPKALRNFLEHTRKGGAPNCPAGLNEAYHSCCARIAIQEGGGRESGEPTGTAGVGRPEVPAAANPAVESLADLIIPKAAANPAARIPLPAMAAHDELMKALERIRELEAELKKAQWLRKVYREDRIVDLTKDELAQKLAEFRSENESQRNMIAWLNFALRAVLHARDKRSPPRP